MAAPQQALIVTCFISIIFASSLQAAISQSDECSGNFSQTCSFTRLLGTVLTTICQTETGGESIQAVNLNDHVGNVDGRLECVSGEGNYGDSCYNEFLDGGTLEGTCFSADGSRITTELDLNQCLTNNNGNLEWTCLSDADTTSTTVAASRHSIIRLMRPASRLAAEKPAEKKE